MIKNGNKSIYGSKKILKAPFTLEVNVYTFLYPLLVY